jgi:hypothetical protein
VGQGPVDQAGATMGNRDQKAGQRVWRLRKQHQSVDAELRGASDGYGVEIQFLLNGEVSYRRQWPTREAALAEAAAKRDELERHGWMEHW